MQAKIFNPTPPGARKVSLLRIPSRFSLGVPIGGVTAPVQCHSTAFTQIWGRPLGGGGHQHRGDVAHHRWHHLRHRPRVLQAEELQRQDGDGVAHRHSVLTGNKFTPQLYCLHS